MNYVRWFDQKDARDPRVVGGKNASLAVMTQQLSDDGILVPHGFALTADAYWDFVKHNKLSAPIKKSIREIKDYSHLASVQKAGKEIRAAFKEGKIPEDMAEQIMQAYRQLSKQYRTTACDVAVRSSATAEDLPTASFAGQQETFLNVKGDAALLEACKKSMASLFTDRAIVYRKEHGFDHSKIALSVGIQKMVRSDKASSGVAFSLDTESGYKEVVTIDSTWGLGETIVQGLVIPDEFCIFKPTLEAGYAPIIKKKLGDKKVKLVYAPGKNPTKQVPVSRKDQAKFSLTDQELLSLARMVITIEKLYTAQNGHWTPMDVEWAKDGDDGRLYITQARPETVHSQEKHTNTVTTYTLQVSHVKPIVAGQAIGQRIISGKACVIKNASEMKKVKKGDIIVTTMTDPDWVPVMKLAAGIVTDLGGRTCHAAIVARELNTLAVVGTTVATKKIKNGQKITLDCSQGTQGFVYNGFVPFQEKKVELAKLASPKTSIMVNIADPDRAFATGMLPVDGVGLARIEFIIAHEIKIHPMALLENKKIKNKKIKEAIDRLTAAYSDKKQFFIETLARAVGMIAAGFYPRPVIVRLSDFKTNEYRDLLGGDYFEPEESNPMLGLRGASRYIHAQYKDAFALECHAVRYARDHMGFDNIKIMVPFVRTVDEARATVDLLAKNGLTRKKRTLIQKIVGKKKNLEFIMMVEVPSNVILIKQFAELFDGFSIGSNDLTQLVLGIDRDSALLQKSFDERDPAVKAMIVTAIEGAHAAKRPIGICGQAPSDYPEFAQFLIDHRIDSISLNPDSVFNFLLHC